MKNIIIIIIALLLFSCEDTLTEHPKKLAAEAFYNTPDEVESALAAIYPSLRTNSIARAYITMQETFSDFFTSRGSWGMLNLYQNLDTKNAGRTATFWRGYYESIRNANFIIKNVPDGSSLTDEEKGKFIGEAKFLRALCYFHLVRNWAGVPIKTEENMDVMDVPRSTADEVWQLILSDLAFAETNLPDSPPVAGKPSKWAAKTLLADVYFYLGKNSEASQKSEEVISSGKFSLVNVTVADDFDKIFGPEVVNTTEEIFYLKYEEELSWGVPKYFHGKNTPYLGSNGYYVIHCPQDNTSFVNWDNNDLRKKFDWYLWETGVGTVYLCKKFSDPTRAKAINDYPLYRYSDVLLIYAEASALAANNPTADGLEKLNMVHRRAYGYDPLQPSPVDFVLGDYNAQSFADLVIQERSYETVGEAKHWFDLKRTGKVKEYIKAATGIDVSDQFLLWPIPENEIEYNLEIGTGDNNPGY